MAKIKRYTAADGGYNGELAFICPACKCRHWVYDKETVGHNLCWEFNDNYEKPTIRASVLVWKYLFNPKTGKHDLEVDRCHSFITDGRIEFLKDSMHKLAGETVELPEIE